MFFCAEGASASGGEYRTSNCRIPNWTGQCDIPFLTHFFFSLCDDESFVAGRTVFLPFTHGPRGFVLSWSTIKAFSAASRGVSEKRLTECAISLLHSLLSELLVQRYELFFRKTTGGWRSAEKSTIVSLAWQDESYFNPSAKRALPQSSSSEKRKYSASEQGIRLRYIVENQHPIISVLVLSRGLKTMRANVLYRPDSC